MMKVLVTISIFCCLVLLMTECMPKDSVLTTGISNSDGEQFAGSAACSSCHAKMFESFSHTAHAITSAHANEQTVLGSFEPGKNVFALNFYERVAMEKRDSGLYQMALHRQQKGEARRFDLVVGSGRGGQSYLYWKDDGLFQLPVSFYTPANSWSGSPGYTDLSINFNRPVTSRCMECHSTYAKSLFPENNNSNRFDKTKLILGVGCESCHGPAAKHAAYHEQHPGEKTSRFVVQPQMLNRQLQLDLCGLCHSGLQENIKPAFNFKPGDSLSIYYRINNDTSKLENLDVHGNKFALLQSSKCFQMSAEMTCSTCHNTHEDEKGRLAAFGVKCMNCHKSEHVSIPLVTENDVTPTAKMRGLTKDEIQQNCVSCHMPNRSSNSLTVKLQDEQTATPAVLRTHRIAVYPGETKKLYEYLDSLATISISTPR